MSQLFTVCPNLRDLGIAWEGSMSETTMNEIPADKRKAFIDCSGSSGCGVDGSYGGYHNPQTCAKTILDAEKESATELAVRMLKVPEIGYWDSSPIPMIYNLNASRTAYLGMRSRGGTDPKTIANDPSFRNVTDGVLSFWTDGEISSYKVPEFERVLPSINFAICIYTGPRNKSPSQLNLCLLYTSPSPRDGLLSRMPSSA